MNKAAYSTLIGVAALLMVALVGAPLWDHWHYRSPRSGPGPSLPFGLLIGRGRDPSPAASSDVALPKEVVTGAAHVPPVPAAPAVAVEPPAIVPQARASAAASKRTMRSASSVPTPSVAGSRMASPRATEAAPASASGPPSQAVRPAAVRPPAPPPPGETPSVPAEPPKTNADDASPAPATAVATVIVGPAPAASAPAPPAAPHPADPTPPAPQSPGGSSATTPAASDPEPPPSDPSQAPTVGLSLTREVVSTGDVVSVNVVLSDGHQITSLPFHLQFNPEVLAYVGAHLGPAFSGGALQPVLLASVNPSRPGDLAVGLSLVDASGSFTGSGAVLVLDFRAVQPGLSDLTFEKASLRGTASQRLEAQFMNGKLTVQR